MVSNWFEVNLETLKIVHRDMGIRYFRKRKVPGSYMLPTSEELRNINI